MMWHFCFASSVNKQCSEASYMLTVVVTTGIPLLATPNFNGFIDEFHTLVWTMGRNIRSLGAASDSFWLDCRAEMASLLVGPVLNLIHSYVGATKWVRSLNAACSSIFTPLVMVLAMQFETWLRYEQIHCLNLNAVHMGEILEGFSSLKKLELSSRGV